MMYKYLKLLLNSFWGKCCLNCLKIGFIFFKQTIISFFFFVLWFWGEREICWSSAPTGTLHDGFDEERDYGHHVRDVLVFKSCGFARGRTGPAGANADTGVMGVALISVTVGTRDLWPLPLMRSPLLTVQ